MLLHRLFLSLFVFSYSVVNTDQLKDVGHVVLVAPPFFGHIIPLLDFAKCLSKYHHVSFVLSSSKFNAIKRRKLVPANQNIQFIELFDQNTEEHEIGNSIANSFIESIIDRMNKPLEELFSSTTAAFSYPIDLIIYDPIVYMTAYIAHQRQISIHAFVPNSLMFIKRCFDISMGNIENSVININFADQIIQTLSLIDGIICNSIEQFDKNILDELHKKAMLRSDLSIRFIAPLITQSNEHQDIDTIEHIKTWLNTQQQENSSSIIYVAFGSLARLEPEQLVEIAHALQNYSVIWSLKTHFQTHLPSSFMNDSKHLLLNWTPQRFILSQSTIRLFISHGGWNSLLESMLAGKITLVWPVFADQFINGYRLENELKTGRCLKNLTNRNEQQIVTRNELGQYLKEIFDHEKVYVDRAQSIQQMIYDAEQNSSRQSFEEIVNMIRNQRLNRYNEL